MALVGMPPGDQPEIRSVKAARHESRWGGFVASKSETSSTNSDQVLHGRRERAKDRSCDRLSCLILSYN
jgi:hypothetical protein